MIISDRFIKNAEWIANAFNAGKITVAILTGNPLAVITIAGVTYTVEAIKNMLDEIYKHKSSFDSSIFRREVREDYDGWLYFDKAERESLRGITNKQKAKPEEIGSPKRHYMYDWSAFHEANIHMIKHKQIAQFVNVTHCIDRMKLFFKHKPGEMALLQLARGELDKEQLNAMKLMFIAVGFIVP